MYKKPNKDDAEYFCSLLFDHAIEDGSDDYVGDYENEEEQQKDYDSEEYFFRDDVNIKKCDGIMYNREYYHVNDLKENDSDTYHIEGMDEREQKNLLIGEKILEMTRKDGKLDGKVITFNKHHDCDIPFCVSCYHSIRIGIGSRDAKCFCLNHNLTRIMRKIGNPRYIYPLGYWPGHSSHGFIWTSKGKLYTITDEYGKYDYYTECKRVYPDQIINNLLNY